MNILTPLHLGPCCFEPSVTGDWGWGLVLHTGDWGWGLVLHTGDWAWGLVLHTGDWAGVLFTSKGMEHWSGGFIILTCH